jgi:hypothetical protein
MIIFFDRWLDRDRYGRQERLYSRNRLSASGERPEPARDASPCIDTRLVGR